MLGIQTLKRAAQMKKKILYIVNPISGTRSKRSIANEAEALTNRNVYDVNVRFTEYKGHASFLTKEAVAQGLDVVVAVGGDGTVNEVARALVHSPTALGILPCGSGNGLARHLHIPLNPVKAIEIINQATVQELDYGTINDRAFFCTCGVGFDALISEKFAEAGKRGLLTYAENTLKEGLAYKPETYTIEFPDGTARYEAFLIACANASQYGNDAYIAPQASMKDGLFNIVVLEPFTPIDAPKVTFQLFGGTLSSNSHVRTFKSNSLIIRRENAGVAHCDGEPFFTGRSIKIQMHHKAFKALVNPKIDEEKMVLGTPIQMISRFWVEMKKGGTVWSPMFSENLMKLVTSDFKRLNPRIFEKMKGNK